MKVQIDLKDRVGELLDIIEFAEVQLVDAMDFNTKIEELSTKELRKRYKELHNASDKTLNNLYKVIEILEIYEF